MQNAMNRREALAIATAAAGHLMLPSSVYANEPPAIMRGRAKHVICLWLGGGMSQIDTFDPKRKVKASDKTAGSYYNSIETAVPDVRISEHLSKVAPLMDRMTAVRGIHHNVIDEHAAATNRMHTGRPVGGAAAYPSIGSLVAHELPSEDSAIPPYVLIGYPNVTRGPGFLGARYGYLYLIDTSHGPAGLSRPDSITTARQDRREQFLKTLGENAIIAADSAIADYEATIQQSLDLSGPSFNQVFDLDREPASLRESYGGEFGQRCLLARRLVERGVRFVEVSHNMNFLNGSGWDIHNEGALNQHALIQELDSALATLVKDLEEKDMLDDTLVVVNTEFGRPPEFDSGGGRGHQGTAFTCVLAGGGLAHCGAWGQTDELSREIVSNPITVPDYFATILGAVGIDYGKYLFDGDRPVPVTDNGTAIAKLFSQPHQQADATASLR